MPEIPGARSRAGSARVRPVIDQVVSAFLLALMGVGSLALWILIPAGTLKLFLPLSSSRGYHLTIGLVAVPAAMITFGLGLSWLNNLYLRINGYWEETDDGQHRRMRGPLETMMLWSIGIAFVALTLWFLLLARSPNQQAF